MTSVSRTSNIINCSTPLTIDKTPPLRRDVTLFMNNAIETEGGKGKLLFYL